VSLSLPRKSLRSADLKQDSSFHQPIAKDFLGKLSDTGTSRVENVRTQIVSKTIFLEGVRHTSAHRVFFENDDAMPILNQVPACT